MRVDSDGTFRLSYAGTALAGSQIMAALKPFTDRAFRQAHKEGRVEPADVPAREHVRGAEHPDGDRQQGKGHRAIRSCKRQIDAFGIWRTHRALGHGTLIRRGLHPV